MKKILPIICVFATCALGAAETASFSDAIAAGKVSINARLRYEGVEQTGLRDANALTLRTRLGYTTAAWNGWKFMLEAENVTAADGDSYSQAGLNPGGAGKAVVADPESTEINQVFASFSGGHTTFTVGRQRLVLDNARFVGDVGWRQNQQTFDGVVLQNKSVEKTILNYAYLQRINRVFSDRHAQGNWDSNSHVLNASYTGFAAGTLTAYSYLLDFDNAAANSTATTGVSFNGAQKVSDDFKVSYRAEFATQADYGSSALNYRANYFVAEAGLVHKQGGVALGHERLGSDNNVGFKTPLATLHAFNGWADMFLATPAAGLRDTYVKANATLPGAVSLLAFYHWYEADTNGANFGKEFNVQASRKFGKYVTATAKYADFSRDSLAFANVSKVWLQIEFIY